MRYRPSRQVVVLAYHAIADLRDDEVLAKWSVTPELFARQLDAILDAGWSFVDLDLVLAALAGERELPKRGVLLSFDDAYADLLDAALPAMARHRAPGVVFAVAGRTGSTNTWDEEIGATPVPLLDGEGLLAAAADGVEVGSHTMNHRPLGKVPAAELDEELVASAELLQNLGLPRPRAFAYPYGDCSPALAAAVGAAGYSAAFTIHPGALTPSNGLDHFLLPRVVVLGEDSPRDLRLKLNTAAWPYGLRRRFLRLMRVSSV